MFPILFQPLSIAASQCGYLLVLADMSTTLVGIMLNLAVVLATIRTQQMLSNHQIFLQLNLVANNLITCVLVKSVEVVFTGVAATTHQAR